MSNIKISDTAFITNAFRASNISLSMDIYANLWVTEKTRILAKGYLNEVAETEDYVHCLRNRFFYNKIDAFLSKHKKAVVINFGSGFSMYPYLFSNQHLYIEIDREDVIFYKKQQISTWVMEGRVPKRHVKYYSCDFGNQKALQNLQMQLQKHIQDLPVFILIEGVLYFLKEEYIQNLFKLCDAIMKENDLLGSVSFLPKELDNKIFMTLCTFCKNQMVDAENFNYSVISNAFYKDHLKCEMIVQSDYVLESDRHQIQVNPNTILNEQLYIFQK